MISTVDLREITAVTSESSRSNDQEPLETNEKFSEEKQASVKEITYTMLLREFFFCLALALTTYAALLKSPPKVSKHPQPKQFFPSGSLVKDYYKGQLRQALTDFGQYDANVVLYYAPWDAESQHVRSEYIKAAEIMSDRYSFSAINCWNPGSECRLQHAKIHTWPVIMTYLVNSRAVMYKGPRDAQSIVRFLELIMTPIKRVSKPEDLVNLLSVCDVVAVGYTPLSETSRYYNVWYETALKIREYDVIGEVCCAVVTSEHMAAELGVDVTPAIRIMLWNETKEYQDELESWTEMNLTQWVLQNFDQPASRVIPMWQKAFSFERHADGPMLVLFTSINPLYDQQPAYDLLKEVAMEYRNCDDNLWTQELIKLQRVQRLMYQQKNLLASCTEYEANRQMHTAQRVSKKTILSQFRRFWQNGTQSKTQKTFLGFLRSNDVTTSSGIEDVFSNSMFGCQNWVFPAEKKIYREYEKCSAYDEHLQATDDMDGIETSMLPEVNDPRTSERLIHEHIDHFCKVMRFAQTVGEPVFPAQEANYTSVRGLACQTNSSLNFVAVDAVRNHHFAESLGVDIRQRKDGTTVVILDGKRESQYELKEPYSAKSLRDFIRDYTANKLNRTLRSKIEDPFFTHYYTSDNESSKISDKRIIISELTTKTFLKLVKETEKVRIVLMCGGGGCNALLVRAAASAVKLLQSCGVRAALARIDVSDHDLPWHYTPHALPAVLLLPPRRGAESQVYPATQRVTSAGLVALVLRALSPPAHLRLRLAICDTETMTETRMKCLKDVRHYITSLIGRNLKYWERMEEPKLRALLLKRLENIRTISLYLEALSSSSNCFSPPALKHFLSTLDRGWDIDVSHLAQGVGISSVTKSL